MLVRSILFLYCIMSITYFPNLELDADTTNGHNNNVNANCITGTITNSIDTTGNITTGSLTVTGNGATILGDTSWNTGSTVNGTNATFSNITLTGANGDTVDNAALPNPITVNISNSLTTSSIVQYGIAGTGNVTTIQSKNYTISGSTTSATICTITSTTGIALTDQFVVKVSLYGSTAGAASTSGVVVRTSWILNIPGSTKTSATVPNEVTLDSPMYTNDIPGTYLGIPTITYAYTDTGTSPYPYSFTITINQVGGTGTTSDGAVFYNVKVKFIPLNNTTITYPTLS